MSVVLTWTTNTLCPLAPLPCNQKNVTLVKVTQLIKKNTINFDSEAGKMCRARDKHLYECSCMSKTLSKQTTSTLARKSLAQPPPCCAKVPPSVCCLQGVFQCYENSVQ